MEFPDEIKREILSYLPHPYKKPGHVEAINKTPLFADFTIDRSMTLEIEKEIDGEVDLVWLNSFIEYRKWRYETSMVYN